MPTRNVNLTDRYNDLVESLIASGQFKNASEVMRAGLRLLEQQAKEDEARLAMLRGLSAEGFAALDRGEGTVLEGEQPLADFIAGIGRRAAKRTADHSSGQ